MQLIPLDRIDDNPFQTRSIYDPEGLAELSIDIQRRRLLQPPVGRLIDENSRPLDPADYVQPGGLVSVLTDVSPQRVQLAFGHRRLRAYRLLAAGAGGEAWKELPVELRNLTDEEMALYVWSENAQRKDITPIEEAQAIQRMIETFGWTQEQVAKQLNIGRATVANKLRLLAAPEEVRTALAKGQMSERQASALLPLADLPAAVLERAEQAPEYNKSRRPSEILKAAANLSSDQIRERIQNVITENTCILGADGNCPVDYAVADSEVKAERCDACPERVRKGTEYRCPDRMCLNRKTQIWTANLLDAASAATGIPAGEGSYASGAIESFERDHEVHLPAIIAHGCPNLRLLFGGWMGTALEGHPHVRVLCARGQDKICTCLDRETGRDREAEARAAEEKERRIHDQLLAPARQAVADALLSGQAPGGLWYLIFKEVRGYGSESLPQDASAKRLVSGIAKNLVSQAVRYDHAENLALARGDLDAWFEAVGLAQPWQTPPEEVILRKLGRIVDWLKKCTREVPSLEAVRGNMANVRHLLTDLDASGAAGETYTDINIRLHSTLELLGSLSVLLQARPADETASHTYGLLNYRWQDLNPDTSHWELSYVLEFAWAIDQDWRAERVQQINARLAQLAQEQPA